MIKEQKFDDCANHGLQHAWKIFEFRKGVNTEISVSPLSVYSTPLKIPIPEGPEPQTRNETSHVRECKNCAVRELFEIKETRAWVRG